MATTQAVQGFQISPQQSALWKLIRREGNAEFGGCVRIAISGELDHQNLQRALTRLVQRHEILRTTFCLVEGLNEPLQVIHGSSDAQLQKISLRDVGDDQQENAIKAHFAELVAHAWDYEKGPLLLAQVFELSATQHELLLDLAGLCADRASLYLLVKELARLYESDSLPDSPPQYADIAGLLLERTGESKERHAADGNRESIVQPILPFEQVLALVGSFTVESKIGSSITSRLQNSARELNISLETLLIAYLDALLHRMGASSTPKIGVLSEGREEPDFARCIGPLSRYVARESSVDSRSLRDFAQFWQNLPAEHDLGSSTPEMLPLLFESDESPQSFEAGSVVLNVKAVRTNAAVYKLRVVCRHDGDSIITEWNYNGRFFERRDVERLAEYFLRICEADIDANVGELKILSASEETWLLHELNSTEQHFGTAPALHELFELQAARTPDATALSFERQTLSYSELNAQAEALAGALQARGVVEGSSVCLCMRRSLEMVIGILGVLKAGACYVSLDPDEATERRAYIVRHSEARIMVTTPDLQPLDVPCPVLAIQSGPIAESDFVRKRPSVIPANPAYLLYTSGSTGQPKGVVIPHGAAVNHMLWMQQCFPLEEADRVLQKTPFQFDASVWEFHSPLAAGAQIVIAPPGLHRDPSGLNTLIREAGITRLQVVPTLLRELLVEGAGFSEITSLRDVFCGGEALPPELVRRFHNLSSARLHNLYGPTETTIDATYHSFSKSTVDDVTPIGRPISNTTLYVLNDSFGLVPAGLPGELFIGGDGVGTGYHAQPGLTAERFLPDPFSSRLGKRMYRTGDIVRYRPDGVLEYHGRSDHQVKLRGFRIELGEIEARLEQHGAVSQAVAITIDGGEEGQQLFAYLMRRPGQIAPSVTDLRDFLLACLPSYMVPSGFMWLDRFPLLPSGKVARKSLPVPKSPGMVSGVLYVPPRTSEEEVLAAIWSDVLGLERVGVRDNFFVLGGDSIRTVQVLALAQKSGLGLKLQDLFERQTIAELAEGCVRDQGPATADDGIPFSLITPEQRRRIPSGVEDAYPLSRLQIGMLYHLELDDRALYHNVNSWHCRAVLDLEMFKKATQEAVERHPNLRTAFELSAFGEPLQLVYESAELPIQFFDISHLSHEEQEKALDEYVNEERHRLFDFTRPPLMRFHIHRRSENTFQFTVTECHAISDGWSLSSTLAEIYERYLGRVRKEPLPELPPVDVTFREFLLLEKAALESEETRNFWADYVTQCAPFQIAKAVAGAAAGQIIMKTRPVPDEILAGARNIARKAKVPLKSVLFAAHLKALGLFTGSEQEVITGLTSNGRPERSGGTEVRGLFLNMLPFRMELRNSEPWTSMVQRVFSEERRLMPHRRYPLLAIQKLKGNTPLFESTFNFVHFHAMAPALRSGTLDILAGYKDSTGTNHPLQVNFALHSLDDSMGFILEYDPAQISAAQADLLEDYHFAVLHAMVADPEALVNANDFMPQELRRLAIKANPLPTEYPSDLTFCDLFRRQVEESPEAVAVTWNDEKINFRELNSYSDCLAAELQRLGAGPEKLVAIQMDRSPLLLMALIGTLKTGAAFVPLDRTSPPARIARQLRQCKPQILLTADDSSVTPDSAERVISVTSSLIAELSQRSEKPKPVKILPDNLAYVIFTSGSTGDPKAIAITHRGLTNYLCWATEYYHVGEGKGAALHSPVSVDLTITSLFAPLLVGKPVHLLPEDPGIESLRRSVRKDAGYSFVKLTPTQLKLLAECSDLNNASGWTRCLIVGGEQLTSDHLDGWRTIDPPVRVVNEYGPAETVVGCSVESCTTADVPEGNMPIGQPIPNARMYLLDESLRPVLEGVPGQIYIAGEGLARGYLGRPDLSAAVFIPDPFSALPGARMYRTGDRGRYLPGLRIEYLGRGDTQVKIRGFRAELGEIEAIALKCPGVEAAVALLASSDSSTARLVLYWIKAAGDAVTTAGLRDFLVENLPPFLTPSVIVELDCLPLLENGKVDKQALPTPESVSSSQPILAQELTETEDVIALVWREVLRLEQIGVEQNFFEAGGDSITVYLVHKKLVTKFNRELAIVDLFRYPTIRALGRYISGTEPLAEGQAVGLAPLRQEEAVLSNREQRKRRLQRAGL
ncbi:MAG TPA: amino acid adenylation domain-containing protein [Candidatus Angelobacter sp.]|nr:amino acid adenylation domain-containing protein [Candidatus Angelobacter sp.]